MPAKRLGVAGKMVVVNKEVALIAPGGTGSVVISGFNVTGLVRSCRSRATA
jgi:hypothetical protein